MGLRAILRGVEFESRLMEEFVAGWWEHARMAKGTRDERKRLETGDVVFADAGWYGVDERIRRGGEDALRVVAALLGRAPDEDAVALVAAGPLEDLLNWHGDALVNEVERLARQDFRFRRALAGVCLADRALDSVVEARLAPWLPRSEQNEALNQRRRGRARARKRCPLVF